MKKILLTGFMTILISQPLLAQPVSVDVGKGGSPVGGGGNSEEILKYLKNLGQYLGFDISEPPTNPVKTQLIDADDQSRMDLSHLVNSYLGAILTTVSQKNKEDSFIPSSVNFAQSINPNANGTIASYSSPNKSDITVSPLIDQEKYQQDPVSQAVLNILTTPDTSWCTGAQSNPRNRATICPPLYRGKVIHNVIGSKIPVSFFNYEWNEAVLNQLNSNSLTSPLMYSVKPSSTAGDKSDDKNLTATSQAAEAANFVRYAISDVLPLQLIAYEDYAKLYRQYLRADESNATKEEQKARTVLENYLASVRVYAAQRSVAISNLYGIMSRRMTQASASDTGKVDPTSEALSEFTMAAWRLKNIGDGKSQGPSQEWIKKINEASSDTVQKEIAVLLAEMNYQMYLSRQQQERILLTNTMILLENMKANAPSLREIQENMAVNQASGGSQVGP